ncbi:MAG: hypothetical protein HC908_01645 [Calothrix sp. SM1_7_51]|nr:hypothetical protein [Calothrix sp. SM1_7_51]
MGDNEVAKGYAVVNARQRIAQHLKPPKERHQDYQKNHQFLYANRIYFSEDCEAVLNRPNEEIQAAIVLFRIRGGEDKIDNPEGFIRHSLECRWWEETRNTFKICEYLGKWEMAPHIDDVLDLFRNANQVADNTS